MIQDPLFLVSVYMCAAVVLRCIKPNVFTALILTVVMIASTAYLGSKEGEAILTSIYQVRDYGLTLLDDRGPWPPELHRQYPDLLLRNADGKMVRLSDYRGKVILLEPIAMSCPACVAFSGGQESGPFQGVYPQDNLESIEKYAENFGNVRLNDPNVIFIQVLLFNQKLQAPTAEEIAAWAKHFGKSSKANQLVLGGTPAILNDASQALIPGFQLIDKSFVLRMDSTGEKPTHDLYRDLLPAIRTLAKQ